MKNTYYFQGVRFLPGYNDPDYADFTIEAASEKEAWELLDKHTKLFTWKDVILMHTDDVKVEAETV